MDQSLAKIVACILVSAAALSVTTLFSSLPILHKPNQIAFLGPVGACQSVAFPNRWDGYDEYSCPCDPDPISDRSTMRYPDKLGQG